MSKVYWVSVYKSVSDPAALAAYAQLASPAMAAHGGVFLAKGNPVQIIESGMQQRVVLIEFESLEKALKRYKHKVIKTKQIEQLRAKQEYLKKSTLKREQMKKAKYKQQIAQSNID